MSQVFSGGQAAAAALTAKIPGIHFGQSRAEGKTGEESLLLAEERTPLKKRIFNLPNLLFVATLLASLLPSQFALERSENLQGFTEFGIVLLLAEAYYLIGNASAKRYQALTDIFSVVFGLLLAWEVLISRSNIISYIFVPAPENVFHVFRMDYRVIIEGFFSSMYLILVGSGLAIVSAVVLGTLVGWVPRLTNAVYPIVKAISTVPALIYTPYIVLIAPSFQEASLAVVFLSIFWGGLMASINHTVFVERKIIDSARVLDVSTFTMLFHIIIPFNLPRIINNLPINLSTALMTLTVAEMIGANSGMGYYVRVALNYADYNKAIAGIIFIGVVVSGLNALISVAKKHLVKWHY